MFNVSISQSDRASFKADMERKQANEGQMGKDIETAVNTSEHLLPELRRLVLHGVRDIIRLVEIRDGDASTSDWFLKAYKDVKAYKYWTKFSDDTSEYGEGHPEEFYEHLKKLVGGDHLPKEYELSAQNCSSLIRFYGECVEAAAHYRKSPTEGRRMRDAGFVGLGSLDSMRRSYQKKTEWGGLFRKGWNEGDKRRRMASTTFMQILELPSPKGREFRTLVEDASPATVVTKVRDWILPLYRQEHAFIEDLIAVAQKSELHGTWVDPGLLIQTLVEAAYAYKKKLDVGHQVQAYSGTGITRWLHLPSDCMAKFDSIFGMRYGATVSGTSCDTMFFLDAVEKVNRNRSIHGSLPMHPLYSLAVIGGIVAGGHHTTNEVAIPLALNKESFRYTISCYGSLFPRLNGDGGRFGRDESRIKEVLAAHEQADENYWMVVYYSPAGQPDGFLYFDKSKDSQEWARVATISRADTSLVSEIQTRSGTPTFRDLEKWPRLGRSIATAKPMDYRKFKDAV